MALLYPWATKEYLLWNMSLGQIVMYYNGGMEAKYGKQDGKPKTATEMSHAELKRKREELRKQFGEIGDG